MGTRAAVILLAMLWGAICGCGTVPQSKYYQLTAPGEADASASAGDPLPITLLVGPLKASHLYREDRLRVRDRQRGNGHLSGAPLGGASNRNGAGTVVALPAGVASLHRGLSC